MECNVLTAKKTLHAHRNLKHQNNVFSYFGEETFRILSQRQFCMPLLQTALPFQIIPFSSIVGCCQRATDDVKWLLFFTSPTPIDNWQSYFFDLIQKIKQFGETHQPMFNLIDAYCWFVMKNERELELLYFFSNKCQIALNITLCQFSKNPLFQLCFLKNYTNKINKKSKEFISKRIFKVFDPDVWKWRMFTFDNCRGVQFININFFKTKLCLCKLWVVVRVIYIKLAVDSMFTQCLPNRDTQNVAPSRHTLDKR